MMVLEVRQMTKRQTTALITGASRGLGRELARALAQRGYSLSLVARRGPALHQLATELGPNALAIVADVAQDAEQIVAQTVERFGSIELLVNNASTIGPSPMPRLADYPWTELERVFRVNTLAPFHLTQLTLPHMAEEGVVLNISSDAGVENYPGWGGYGASKAALEHLSRTFAEETGRRIYVVDPGDMDTEMHRQAEPGVDLSHLPGPEAPVPFLMDLLERSPEGFGRFQAQRDAVLQ